MKQQNPSLFFSYFFLFLIATLIGRSILSPTEHYFVLWMQVVSVIAIPYLFKHSLSFSSNSNINTKIIAGTLFFLFYVLMWEIMNFIPFIGFAFSILMYKGMNVNLGIDWSFVLLKPLFMFVFIYTTRHFTFTAFNTLISNKNVKFDNIVSIEQQKLFQQKDPKDALIEIKENISSYVPPQVSLYYNELTHIVSLSYDKKEKKGIKAFNKEWLSLTDEDNHYFFFNYQKNYWIKTSKLSYKDNVLRLFHNNEYIFIQCKDLPPSIKEALIYIVKPEVKVQETTSIVENIQIITDPNNKNIVISS